MEKEKLKVDKEQLIGILVRYWDETTLALWAYDGATDKEEITPYILENNDKEELWDYFDDETKMEIAGDTLGPRYSAIKIIENTDINDLLETIMQETDLTLEDIVDGK